MTNGRVPWNGTTVVHHEGVAVDCSPTAGWYVHLVAMTVLTTTAFLLWTNAYVIATSSAKEFAKSFTDDTGGNFDALYGLNQGDVITRVPLNDDTDEIKHDFASA